MADVNEKRVKATLEDDKVDIDVQIGCFEMLIDLMKIKTKDSEEAKILEYLSKNLELLLNQKRGEFKLDKDFFLLQARVNYLKSNNKEILNNCFNFLNESAQANLDVNLVKSTPEVKEKEETPDDVSEEILNTDYEEEIETLDVPTEEIELPPSIPELNIDHLDLPQTDNVTPDEDFLDEIPAVKEEVPKDDPREKIIEELLPLMYPDGLDKGAMDNVLAQLNYYTLEQLEELKEDYKGTNKSRS